MNSRHCHAGKEKTRRSWGGTANVSAVRNKWAELLGGVGGWWQEEYAG